MTGGSIRRAQLISPFGVGAMSVLVGGSSVLAAGLDHWFDGRNVDVSDFRIDEWRLSKRLGVTHFRLPPDYRTSSGTGQQEPNLRLTVPFLRFPTWSFCPFCKRLHEHPLAFQGRPRCVDTGHAEKGQKQPVLAQVPFVIACERGHLADFPWREWVHHSLHPQCHGTLRLSSGGGGSLAGQIVSCDGCKARRPLTNITNTSNADGEASTVLTRKLADNDSFDCLGSRPWLGNNPEPCGLAVRATLRGASNVYFPLVQSSIYLPQGGNAPEDLMQILRKPQFSVLGVLQQSGMLNPATVRATDNYGLLSTYDDDELQSALDQMFNAPGGDELSLDVASETDWRRPEYNLLRATLTHPDLTISEPSSTYGPDVAAAFERVRLVETLRETRALWGFTRLNSASDLKLSEGKARLWKDLPPVEQEWLPAYEVRGEGIYLELDQSRLAEWESQQVVRDRATLIVDRYASVRADRGLGDRELTPRLILLHTIAHLLINQLIFECGYSSASLRERLYVSGDSATGMAGILIYTAAGDSEGTMGGLVRMGHPGNLERVWDAALAAAEWCSTDPICMEAGESGQGPDSCNLAACHACALLPETSCEEFNRFLDRGMVVGSLQNPGLGYFTSKG
jgi:hypothetical protein